jgi:DNA polymerase-3 subunit alpha
MERKQDLKGVLFFDCETTGIPGKGAKWDIDFMQFPYVVQLAWIIDGKERSYIVEPEGWEIPDEVVAIHGITTEIALAEGIPFSELIDEFTEDAARSGFIVAHNIHFDTSLIKANILRSVGREYYDSKVEDALSKGKRIDTMMKTIKFVNAKYPDGRAGKFPKLEELFEKLFPGETFRAHDALEDVNALVRCLPELIRLGVIEMKIKEYKD